MSTEEKYNALIKDADSSSLKRIRKELGDEAADKVHAIVSILAIGERRSVAYSRAILAAAEMALESYTTFLPPNQ